MELATYRCGGCKQIYYCSQAHQKLDWREGGHREICKKIQLASLKGEKTENSIIGVWKETLRIDPEHAYAYYEIAFQLFPDSTTILNGKLWSAMDLLKHSISLDANFVGPLIEMALHLSPNQSTDIGNSEWTAARLYTKAIGLDPEYYVPYHNLAVVLSEGSTIRIGEKEWSREELYKKAEELRPAGDPPLSRLSTIRKYYKEEDNLQFRQKANREEVWGDQSEPPFEQLQKTMLQNFELRMKLKKREGKEELNRHL